MGEQGLIRGWHDKYPPYLLATASGKAGRLRHVNDSLGGAVSHGLHCNVRRKAFGAIGSNHGDARTKGGRSVGFRGLESWP